MSDPKSNLGEFGLIAWLRERSKSGDRISLGIGDDCAALKVRPGAELLVTTDMLMDGRHFRLDRDGPEAVGYKALGVNLSDIAAMAGVPVAALVAVALPRSEAVAVAKGIHDGMMPLAERFGVDLVGGDTNAWDGPLVVCVTLLGETTARGAVRRSGAKVGDALLVTGPLGGSLLGRHLRPLPRVAEALALHEAAPLHAAIDISDGLSSDLRHILDESGKLGAILEESAIPIHPSAKAMSQQDGRPAIEHALHDGEDFELCLAVAPEDVERLRQAPATLFKIGEVVDRPGIRLHKTDGTLAAIEPAGFDHLRAGVST
jgi:thiamine-monophosphate kinase